MEHPIVSPREWLAARKDLLASEKELARLREHVSAARRALPWVRVEKHYVFEGPKGPVPLADLFEERSQLIIKFFAMSGEDDPCVGCSFEVDHAAAARRHLENHDVSYAVVARAPIADIEAYRKRMDWDVTWVSSADSGFTFDFGASLTPEQMARGAGLYDCEMRKGRVQDWSGHAVFYRNERGQIFHTYSAFGRGAQDVLTSYMYLDLTPKGRNAACPKDDYRTSVKPHNSHSKGATVEGTPRHRAAEAQDVCCSG